MWRRAAGLAIGLVARAWVALLRVTLVVHPSLERSDGSKPWVLCFWHGTQLPALAASRRRPTVAMVSHSADGAMQTVAMTVMGMTVVRGSSSRGGAAGMRGVLRAMRRLKGDGAFAVDGPRGPHRVAKMGAIVAARLAGARLVPVGAASARSTVLARAWDRFVLPWPLSRVVVVLGEPLDPELPDACGRLSRAIDAANAQATSALAAAPPMLRGAA